MALRLIQGGRASDGLPGLLVEHAAEVATMAGGLRLGIRMDDPALLVAPDGDAGHEAAPAVACWEGRILATGPRNDLLQALEGIDFKAARAVVLYSSLKQGFCAGADLKELYHAGKGMKPAERAKGVRDFLKRIHGFLNRLDEAPVPTVAAVHGAVFGGGLELALACDLIVADRSTRFAFPELRLGLVPGFGGIPRLKRDVANSLVRDLLFTGRSINAEKALQAYREREGLVNQEEKQGLVEQKLETLNGAVLEARTERIAKARSELATPPARPAERTAVGVAPDPAATAAHIIELIEGLGDEDEARRRNASDALRQLTGVHFGFVAEASKRERDTAQRRYRDWWLSEGRQRFR